MADLLHLTSAWGRVSGSQMVLVAQCARPACRITVAREKLAALRDLAGELGLAMTVGFDTITTRPVPGRPGYGEWCTRTAAALRNIGRVHVYLALTIRAAERLRRADESEDILTVGDLLGYPGCCIDAFRTISSNRGDPILCRYDDKRAIDWHVNVSLLCFDYSIIPYIPCRTDCPASRTLARKYLDVVARNSLRIAGELAAVLRSWVLHSDAFGVVAFAGEGSESEVVVRRVLLTQPSSVLGAVVAEGSHVTLSDEHVAVSGCEFSRANVRLFRFGELATA